ncbi:MAG: NAD-dependent epimerase/dehydratase family protein [Candidatus Eisenbacteria bacterium]
MSAAGGPGLALVTGAAGFIGSHLGEALVARGFEVVGVDCFTDYYDPAIKRRNLAGLLAGPRFRLLELDLSSADLADLPARPRWVFHQAAQAGVRASWGREFESYARHNVLATQRLLERYRDVDVERVVVASSSSVYGDAERLPTTEEDLPRPYSPYGVTKLAAEHLALLYARNFGLPAVALRYFTVYGPRQRPDMGFHRFVSALLAARPITVYGDGEQTRDFTFIADAVAANLAAAERGTAGRAYNIGGGSRVSVNHVLAELGRLAGIAPIVEHGAAQPGDPRDTGANIARARTDLAWSPSVALAEGLARQLAWQREGA